MAEPELDDADMADVDMADEGPQRPSPERLCIVSRERLPIARLLRFVAAPDGILTPDLKRQLPGRGVWVEATRAKLEMALKRKAFGRSLRTAVKIPDDLTGLVERLLEKDALQALALANKAGKVVAGQSKVETELSSGRVMAVFHAADAARDSVRKIGQVIRRHSARLESAASEPLVMSPFQSVQMSLYLGREHVIHICLVNDPTSKRCVEKCQLLTSYLGLSLDTTDMSPDNAFGSDASDPESFAIDTSGAQRTDGSG